jgi:uncharacterized phage protein (TIGR01671 family)
MVARKIKFRAWDKDLNIMLPVELMDFRDWWVRTERPDNAPNENGNNFYAERNSFKNEETDRHILMQYTGLKDKNDKEIYEGDIVIFYHNLHKEDKRTIRYKCIVEWDDGGLFCKRIKQDDFWGFRNETELYEIIGNIYETDLQK